MDWDVALALALAFAVVPGMAWLLFMSRLRPETKFVLGVVIITGFFALAVGLRPLLLFEVAGTITYVENITIDNRTVNATVEVPLLRPAPYGDAAFALMLATGTAATIMYVVYAMMYGFTIIQRAARGW